jgi:hypothetical protein
MEARRPNYRWPGRDIRLCPSDDPGMERSFRGRLQISGRRAGPMGLRGATSDES